MLLELLIEFVMMQNSYFLFYFIRLAQITSLVDIFLEKLN